MHRTLLVLFAAALGGCFSLSIEDRASLAVLRMHGRDAAMVRYVEIEGRRTMFARDGWVLLDGPTRVAVVAMLQERRKRGIWPEPTEITTPEEKWRSSVAGDCLFIERVSGTKSIVPVAFVASDGYVSADEKLLPMIETMDQIAAQMRR